ncbi:MAG: glycosyltransferase family 2 protein [Desulfomicrobium sp.]|nr:glycosyltransferase family 2 protein [Desulfomicrobium sp.]
MTFLFWFSLLALVYAFIGYPLLVRLAAALWGRKTLRDENHTPTVSVLLSVYNEEQVIRQKIENFLQLDYPEDRIELLVISDGCSDQTEEIVRSLASNRVRLLIQEERGGKTLALNRGALEAKGEIFVFTDANSMFRPDSVRKLMAAFADPSVGLVSGRSVYVDAEGNETLGGIYRRYEEWIKEGESRLFSIVGADGAIYALRRDVFEPLKPEFINDLLHPIQVVSKGLKAVSEPWAVVVEAGEDDAEAELKRQTRIMAQSWHVCLRHLGKLIRERRYGFVWQVLSHKILRWLALPFFMGLGYGAFFGGFDMYSTLSMIGLVIFFAIAWLGSRGADGIAKVVWMFVVLHWAAVLGLCRLAKGEMFIMWDPRNS